jgi:hypothetical protein
MQELILRIVAVLLSVSIALTPWLYPNYSLFNRRAITAIETLQTPRVTEDDIEAGYIERGEKGFSELQKVAQVVFGYYENIERIWFAWGSPPDIADFADLDGNFGGFGDNGIIYAEDSSGQTVRLRYRPGSPQKTRRLEDLYAGAVHLAQQRAQKLTGGLAIIWATIMMAIIVL